MGAGVAAGDAVVGEGVARMEAVGEGVVVSGTLSARSMVGSSRRKRVGTEKRGSVSGTTTTMRVLISLSTACPHVLYP